MQERLLVAVLGHRNAGKTTTWHTLFGSRVRTGTHTRRLYINDVQYVDDVFLVNGSAEERGEPIGNFVPQDPLPRVVLCSTQYVGGVKATYDFFFARGFEVIVQWLNPGYSDPAQYRDSLGLVDYLLDKGATLHMRDGKTPADGRVRELRQFILGWATYRDLVCTEFPP